MTDPLEARQKVVDALLEDSQSNPLLVEKRLLQLARIGVESPANLTSIEIKQICLALVVHFHQLGID